MERFLCFIENALFNIDFARIIAIFRHHYANLSYNIKKRDLQGGLHKMQGKGFMLGFYRFSEWVMRLAYVNLLWILFILVGGIILGFGPSTVAMFAVTRKWVMGEVDIPVYKTFWNSYKTEFKKANVLMILLLLIGYVLYLDLKFFQGQEGIIYVLISYIMLGLMFLYVVITMYIFPIFVHYELKLFQYFRNAFLFSLMHPFLTIIMGVFCLTIYYLLIYVPGLIPFFGGGLFSLGLMWLSYRSFISFETTRNIVEQRVDK